MSEQTTRPDGSPEPIRPLDPPDPVPEAAPAESSQPSESAQPAQPSEPVSPEEPEPFSDGPPPLPEPMLVLDGTLGADAAPEAEPAVDHGTCGSCGGAYDEDGWCTRCGERRPDPRHHFTAQPSATVAAVCDRGIRHTSNEDAMAVWAPTPDVRGGHPGDALLVVCDGVSSAPRSAEASLAAADAALQVLTTSDGPADERLAAAADAADAAVDGVGAGLGEAGGGPSCTFVAAVLEDGSLTVGSVGDSRAYWFPDEGAGVRLSTDDSMAEEQIKAGIPRAEAESGPLGHTITRWLGPDAHDHRPRITTADVSAPGWVLLCSDGLWNYASEPEALLAVLREQEQSVGREPLALAEALVDWANRRGGVDNITVALARCGDARQDGHHG